MPSLRALKSTPLAKGSIGSCQSRPTVSCQRLESSVVCGVALTSHPVAGAKPAGPTCISTSKRHLTSVFEGSPNLAKALAFGGISQIAMTIGLHDATRRAFGGVFSVGRGGCTVPVAGVARSKREEGPEYAEEKKQLHGCGVVGKRDIKMRAAEHPMIKQSIVVGGWSFEWEFESSSS